MTLSPELRELTIQAVAKGMTTVELAELFGINVPAMRGRLRLWQLKPHRRSTPKLVKRPRINWEEVAECYRSGEALDSLVARFNRHINTIRKKVRAACPDIDHERRVSIFWSSVDKRGTWQPRLNSHCWHWTGRVDTSGYGVYQLRIGGSAIRGAHRIAFVLNYGAIRHQVLHHCDNAVCVNPAHLYDGTQRQNCADRARRGGSYLRPLSNAAVKAIRERYANGESVHEIAKDYPRCPHSIYRLATGRTRADVRIENLSL